MEEAIKRIQNMQQDGPRIIRLNDLDLTELPELPDSIFELDCSYNKLTHLPNKFPSEMKHLNVNHNKLQQLPTLPSKLQSLVCSNNPLSRLPDIPESLQWLACWNCNLVKLPKVSSRCLVVCCPGNPYLNTRGDGVYCYHRDEPDRPDYSQTTQGLKKIYSGLKRVRKLIFVNELQDHIDEFRYRPDNAEYLELKARNKGKFADL